MDRRHGDVSSKLPLAVGFRAAYPMATHANGIVALQLQAQMRRGSYKSARLLAAKRRRAMVALGTRPARRPGGGRRGGNLLRRTD